MGDMVCVSAICAVSFFPLNVSELPPRTRKVNDRYLADFDAHVAALSKRTGLSHPGMIFLYPEKRDLLVARHSTEWLPERKELQAISGKYGLTLVDVAQNSAWTDSLYRDAVHPSAWGNVVLAKIISDATLDTLMSDALNTKTIILADKTPPRSLLERP
jgi:hypothetical protein